MSIKSDGFQVNGTLGFNDLTAPFQYQGKGTPRYGFTINNLSEAAADRINDRFGEDVPMGGGKRIKFDENYPESGLHTKFSSQFPIEVRYEGAKILTGGRDENGNPVAIICDPIATRIGRGSKIRTRIFGDANGNPRAQYIEVIELVEFGGDDEDYADDEVL